ncbi:MAG: ABC transporter permease subunit [Thermoflexales bacterium]|nr:ABC transporter permease subunit [Thermoflexales bacterium]MDW8350710.1 ABC transporter permease subunit [Anaerolineae bacterium]
MTELIRTSPSVLLAEKTARATTTRRPPFRVILKQHWMLYAMLLPALILLALFHFYPIWGVLIAFKDYSPVKGILDSPWVGLDNFRRFFESQNAWPIIRNTLFIAIGKIFFVQLAALVFALMLNEVRIRIFKRAIQTATTLPHFLSWVIIGGIMVQILSTTGVVNRVIGLLGIAPIRFLGRPDIFPWTLIFSEVWKEFGFAAVIYLAALTAINPELYEAAAVDGAGRFGRLFHITLPGIRPTIVLMACLSLGSVLNAGFEQVLVLYNPVVYRTGDIIDTFVFRVGLVGQGGMPDYGLGAAVGLLKSGIGFFLILLSYWLADRFANYRIF